MLVRSNQQDSAIRLARESGLREGDTALVQLNAGVAVVEEESQSEVGELILPRPSVGTLCFCSSQWRILEKLPPLELPDFLPKVEVVGRLPDGLPYRSFVEGEFVASFRNGRLHLRVPPLVRAARVPNQLVDASEYNNGPWERAWGPKRVAEYAGYRGDFAQWFNDRCEVLRN